MEIKNTNEILENGGTILNSDWTDTIMFIFKLNTKKLALKVCELNYFSFFLILIKVNDEQYVFNVYVFGKMCDIMLIIRFINNYD